MIGTARDITTILELGSRDADAESELFELVKQRFHSIAQGMLRHERQGHSLQPTMLVDDAFLNLIQARDQDWHSREEFFSHAAKVMRHLLVDHARAKLAVKRGRGEKAVAIGKVGEPADSDNPHSLIETK